jgi:hypothetical protein
MHEQPQHACQCALQMSWAPPSSFIPTALALLKANSALQASSCAAGAQRAWNKQNKCTPCMCQQGMYHQAAENNIKVLLTHQLLQLLCKMSRSCDVRRLRC